MFINPFAVVVAALLGFGLGALWYSPYLLGRQWQEIMGTPWKEAGSGYNPRQALFIELAATLVMAFVLGNLSNALGVHGPLMALRLGFWVWLGFQVTILFSSVVFERRPMKLFYINAGERLASTLAMSLVVGLWP